MEFRCRLGTPGGEILEGIYVAESEDRLRRELEEKGLYILSLQRRGGLTGVSLTSGRRGRISRQEFLVFNQELATLLKAGMPLVQSLDILRQRVANATFKAVLDDVYDKVKSGTGLSDAFAAHGNQFPAVYAASLMAGERSGNLDAVIRRYVAYEKVIGAVKKRTISALIYPLILTVMMTVPWVGPTMRKFSTAQLARTLSTLLGGGIPLVDSLEIARRSLSNRFMA